MLPEDQLLLITVICQIVLSQVADLMIVQFVSLLIGLTLHYLEKVTNYQKTAPEAQALEEACNVAVKN